MVSVLTCYSEDPSSIPAGCYIFSICTVTKINEKEAGDGPFSKNLVSFVNSGKAYFKNSLVKKRIFYSVAPN